MQERCEAAAGQMVEVVHGSRNADWLVKMVEGLLYGTGEAHQTKNQQRKRRDDVADRCKALVGCLVEFLLSLEEGHLPLATQVIMSCHVLSCPVMSCHVVPCHVI